MSHPGVPSLPHPSARLPKQIWGVDFSGAKLAGRTIWLAQCATAGPSRPRLLRLDSLATWAGVQDRGAAMAALVQLIAESHDALWAIDFPFGLPVEIMRPRQSWPDLLTMLHHWRRDPYDLGLWCLARAKARGGANHIRRITDTAAKTPFSCYHYRIIYQTFFGMRDVLGPLCRLPGTAILPFQGRRLDAARRIIVEACPSSTLKRLGLPHQNYKQPGAHPLTAQRRRTRRAIMAALDRLVEISPAHRRLMLRDRGGDALDACLAAVGALHAWKTLDHPRLAQNPRISREGYIYA